MSHYFLFFTPKNPVQILISLSFSPAFVNLKGTSEENGLCGANIHSFMGLKRFDYDISKMQRAVYNDPEVYYYCHYSVYYCNYCLVILFSCD